MWRSFDEMRSEIVGLHILPSDAPMRGVSERDYLSFIWHTRIFWPVARLLVWISFFLFLQSRVGGMAQTSKKVEIEFNKGRWKRIELVYLRAKQCDALGSSPRTVRRHVGRSGWILPTPASAEAAVDLNYQIIGCIAFWEKASRFRFLVDWLCLHLCASISFAHTGVEYQ